VRPLQGLGSGAPRVKFRVSKVCGVQGSGSGLQGSGFRVQGSGF
jgi:hypothetical protein